MNKMIPSEVINVDENGDAVIGKNLKVGGKLHLNGEFANVRSYEFTDNTGTKWILDDYGAISTTWDYHIIGLSDEPGSYLVFGLGFYQISEEGVNWVEVLGLEYFSAAYQEFSYYDGVMRIKVAAYEENTQPKLYRHKLTVNNLFVLMYNSTSNLKVNSVDDLRTIMKISTTVQEILPVCASDATAMATLVVTSSLCQVNGVDVTAVSDVVNPL